MMQFIIIISIIIIKTVSVFSWEIWNSECYYYSSNALENSGAQNSCNKMYSHLVEVETLEEYTELTKYMTNGLQYWTGARIDASNNYYWLNGGGPILASLWASYAPDSNSDCARLKNASHTGDKWRLDDIECTTSYNYICEKKLDEDASYICEESLSENPNIAVGKPAKMSSIYNSSMTPASAVDGITEPLSQCSTTGLGTEVWWQVDFEGHVIVYNITITNRADCCENYLRDIEIRLYSFNPGVYNGGAAYTICGYYAGPASAKTISVKCSDETVGRWLRIIKTSSTATIESTLTLCEVDVYGVYCSKTNQTRTCGLPSIEYNFIESTTIGSSLTTSNNLRQSSTTSTPYKSTTEVKTTTSSTSSESTTEENTTTSPTSDESTIEGKTKTSPTSDESTTKVKTTTSSTSSESTTEVKTTTSSTSSESTTGEKTTTSPTSDESTIEGKTKTSPTSDESTTKVKTTTSSTSSESTTEVKTTTSSTSSESTTGEKTTTSPTSGESTTKDKTTTSPTSDESITEEKTTTSSDESSTKINTTMSSTSDELTTEVKTTMSSTFDIVTTTPRNNVTAIAFRTTYTTTNCLCTCMRTNLTEKEILDIIQKITDDLRIRRKSTNAYLRTLVSAHDDRPSVKRIGGSGLAIIIFVFSLFLISDLLSLVSFLYSCRRLRREDRNFVM